MKKILLLILFTGLLQIANAHNDDVEHQKFNELIEIQMPGHFIKTKNGILNVTGEQKNEIILNIHPIGDKIKQLSKKIASNELKLKQLIMDGKSKEELKLDLDNLASQKRLLVDLHIDALKSFKKIFTEKQWLLFQEISTQKR